MGKDKKFIEFTEEELRLLQKGGDVSPWEKWGPYVSERAWGTVREDYSPDGRAWDHFPHEMAPYRAYRWGEDGIAGISDRYQVLALTQAFWNGKDPILKERLYGVNSIEGNHGEDVKEYYYYLDALPTHAYMRYLYKYPCAEYPYKKLKEESQKRGVEEAEYELIDTGIFNENRYFDITIEYAKEGKDDICIKINIKNHSSEEESIHVIPHLIFRNTWSWWDEKLPEPLLKRSEHKPIHAHCIEGDDEKTVPPARLSFDYKLGKRYFYADDRAELLFTNNETNQERMTGKKGGSLYTKDAFHEYIIHGKKEKINPEEKGTKASFYFRDLKIPAGGSEVLYLRFTNRVLAHPLTGVDEIIQKRKGQADLFYETIHPEGASDEEKMIQRQALGGMIWTKQIYLYDVHEWIQGDSQKNPAPESRHGIRNVHWKHLISKRILSMPDKWEYPWFAAWDLAFHCISLALVDMDFAKNQLWYLLFDQFQHPNGQVPAYEWEFSHLNPPVQGWGALRLFYMEEEKTGKRDYKFLKKCFHKLILNFVWWVNKVDAKGNNVFEGGFLGLDNITVIDRSQEIPGGGNLEQSDGTGWMGFFCINLMRMALELAKEDPVYEGMAIKFFEHFVYIASALVCSETRKEQNWDEEDGFFYDVLTMTEKDEHMRIKVRSLVGIVPLFAVDCVTAQDLEQFKEFASSFHWFTQNRPDLCQRCVTPIEENGKTKYLLTLMEPEKIERVLKRAWDPEEFRSDFGLRSLSKFHEKNPYELLGNRIKYEPGEAESVLMGGNSNWRGPIWLPTSFLFIEALKALDTHASSLIKVDDTSLHEMAKYYANAMINLFKRDASGKRPIYGECEKFQNDPHFRDHILFFEHFHGDNGRGLGASHQTGWSGLVANLIDEWR